MDKKLPNYTLPLLPVYSLVRKIGASRADVVKQLVLFKLTEMGYFDEKP